ncbi:MAG: hypothetical protein J3K34DRAFT_520265 [Monoraphidium minutum]|nr:MAG: hypothetical protein J3K34DRAFT_520265 [Monoraphidium minutum]
MRSGGGSGGGAAVASGVVEFKHPLWWHAPIWSGSGYGSEANSYLLALLRSGRVRPEDVWVSNHGQYALQDVMEGMDPADREELQRAEARPQQPGARNRSAIVVCHSVPANYATPWAQLRRGEVCPPNRTAHPWSYLVARTMWEASRVSHEFARRCNTMDEVWVTSAWQVEGFKASGIDDRRLVVVPEAVNTTLFDPASHPPLRDLESRAVRVFGAAWADKAAAARGRGVRRPFRFVSTFEWTERKGWDVLLEAYLSEFSRDDDVELMLRTRPWGKDGGDRDVELPGFYALGDAFVLPTRGEGWGRPLTEAMSMGLPVIATNWSGLTAFFDAAVGYPLAMQGLTRTPDPDTRIQWAQPSVPHLRQLMRAAAGDRAGAAARGAAARSRMVARYSPSAIAEDLIRHWRRIDDALG